MCSKVDQRGTISKGKFERRHLYIYIYISVADGMFSLEAGSFKNNAKF